MFYKERRPPTGAGGTPPPSPAQRGPAQALYERRARNQPANPGAFCAALLGPLTCALPDDVDPATWRLALEHLARTAPSDTQFRRLLEQRARVGPDGSRDAGARVAAFLLREWERYGVARLLGPGPSRRGRERRGPAGRRPAAPGIQRALRLALRGVDTARSPAVSRPRRRIGDHEVEGMAAAPTRAEPTDRLAGGWPEQQR